ncbi:MULTISPECIES: class A beta-lactamase [unclassified Rhizobium]|uniref:class A beta-lactamase n=1 Tax=unclassified Rhizobium TaxID=2613769 RepID=UPI000712A023|nr:MULTISPECIES: class A beta-lactamase [unclassified Rhizobium]KQS96785.1 class A beta-lactamase [Rhizobium sp. Leaf386]KQT06700.1 class A beta-lactamase [Rhizobium sp. Leaf391]KQU10287.1 class A beta-lactamase [Rhizobium sp. Leaf453]
MLSEFNRRTFLIGSSLLLPAMTFGAGSAFAATDDADVRLAALEKATGGRLGVSVIDVAMNISFGRRQDERFAMCSTFKMLAAACILARVDNGEERLDRKIAYSKADLVDYSPMTENHTEDGGMTVAELCEAAVTVSDNTAANLLLASMDGPEGLTRWLRGIDDQVTRLDRIEPELNEAKKDDPRDTTTPHAMLTTMGKLLLDDALSEKSRDQLTAWLVGNKTGDKRLRAGLPKGWTVGDKTGTSATGAIGDVAIVWPSPNRPILITAYIAEATKPAKELEYIFAEIGKMVGEMAKA